MSTTHDAHEVDRLERGRDLTLDEIRCLIADRQTGIAHGTAPTIFEAADQLLRRLDDVNAATIVDQPPPKPNAGVPVWDLVIADMRERDSVGRLRYGTPLQTGNGRNALVDAYQEALDLVVYLRQAIEERDG